MILSFYLKRWSSFSYVFFIMNTQHTDEAQDTEPSVIERTDSEQVLLDKCRRNLAIIWFLGGAPLYIWLILQSAFGFYGENLKEVWLWFLPNILPILSLIIGSTLTSGHPQSSKKISRFAARLCCYLSAGYLLTLGLTMLLSPLPQILGIKEFASRLEFLKTSSLWLAPFQGLVSGTLGAVFISKRSSINNRSSDNNSA